MSKELARIAAMVGQSFMYKKEVYHIKGFIPEESKVRIKTNREDLVLLNDGLHHSLTLFLEVEAEELEVLPAKIQKSEVQNAIGSLSQILQENIQKVRESKDYIPQAESINTSVKTFIDLAKAEIDYRKTELKFLKMKNGK